uniref:Ubiquitin specific peptidase 40 n=1 Tax=Paramormyrops kingsleyae TaxID=1676925 RepID=A0A3B3S873_9TELE
MFGNLFEEDEEGFSPVTVDKRVDKGKDAEPPPARGTVNLSGIRNQGGTCYLNSLLQTLLFTPEFREELFRLGPDELGCLEDKDKPEAKVRVIPLELQRLFAELLLLDQQTASTAQLTDSFGWTSREESSQHDVQELNRILFSALESSLVGTSGSDLIHRLYHGVVVNQIVCKECGNVSEREEDYLDLTVSVSGLGGLEEALWSMFVEEEVFDGNNLYRCSRCNVLVKATKSAKLRKLPPFLTVSLLRFSFDFAKCERFKETGRYTFPLSANLKPFCEQAEQPDSEYTYELFSVIIHKGGCHGGHYHVYIKDIDELGHWEMPVRLCVNTNIAVLVEIYRNILSGQEASRTVLVDQLGQKLLDKIGISWNKKFRKQHGPIGKFLQSQSDVFLLVSNGTRVTLKATTPTVAGGDAAPESQAAEEGPGAGDGPHWFDLNDSTVTPIHERDIQKQFQGKESAYMLFYRKAGLLRPQEAKQNRGYTVPPHLLQMAQEENVTLQQRRWGEYDASANTVQVRLHLAPQYRLENGALQPKAAAEDTVTLSFDRRRTVGDFRLAVYQMQDLWEGDMALTVARKLPAGLHLYNTLTDDAQSLYAVGVSDGSDLFVWNGREVSGAPLRMGCEWEPVLLTLLRACDEAAGDGGVAGSSALMPEPRGFPGGATLGALRQAVGPEDTLLCREESRPGCEGGGGSGWRVFPPADMQRTLKELALKDGDSLLVLEPQVFDTSLFSLTGDTVTVTTPSDCRWLQVESHLCAARGAQGEGGEDEGARKQAKISASGSTLLSEVKLSAIEELKLQDQFKGVPCCLRQADRTGKLLPPVREDMTVREAGIKLMTSLVLCPGAAPGPHQLFLYFTVSPPVGTEAEMEIIVEETITVKEVSRACECWHLRKMDWCEELGDALTDEVRRLKYRDKVPRRTLLFRRNLHPELLCKDVAFGPYAGNRPALAWRFSAVWVSLAMELISPGPRQVLTLPPLHDLCVPSPAFLRVWLLESRRPGRILRGNLQPLQKLKLASGTELCVQRLQKEENLGPKELLLNVQIGIPGERSYYPSQEVVWDTGRDGSARGLRQAIAAHCSLCPDSLIIAKYCPEKYSWMVISSWTQQVSKRKKKKKTESLLGAPFHLRDGDVIGGKNLLIDSNREFSTPEDELGQQRLQEEAGTWAKGYVALECKGSRKSRKPEVALSINVGMFR